MSDQQKENSKRNRRSKHEIEQSMFEAATKIISKGGFPSLTVTGLILEAQIDPPVFYNRYLDIEDFVSVYVRNYDYWLRDTIDVTKLKDNPIDNMILIIDGLIDSLLTNIPMQKLIAWEMNEENNITKRTSMSRDLTAIQIINYFMNALKNCKIQYDATLSLIIGGIYYLVIHKGTFNFIDFSKKESIELLKKNIHMILRKVFDDYKTSNTSKEESSMKNVAIGLIKNKVDSQIIKEVTGLDDKELNILHKQNSL